MTALRTGVALSRLDHIVVLGLYGPHAADLVDRLVPRAMFLRDGGMAPTLLLDAHGRILADVTVVADDADFVLLAEGMEPNALCAHVRAQLLPGEEVELRDMWVRYRLLGVTGPYAWELMEAFAGPEILGVPHLGAAAIGDDICFRTGKTGEWGYQLLVPAEAAEERMAQLVQIGGAYDAVIVDCETLDTAALENGSFVIRVDALRALNPVELQLQWCLTPGKEGFVGAEAVAGWLAGPPQRRLTLAVADSMPAQGAEIHGDGPVGTVLHARPMLSGPGVLVLALLDEAVALPGQRFAAGVPIRTISAPAVPLLSLALDPQRHRYATREQDFGGRPA